MSSMQEYVSDPARIVYACWDHKDIARLGNGVFRLTLAGQAFMSISIDMSVDIKLQAESDGTIQCTSVGYSVDSMAKILGKEFVDTFFLKLRGQLKVEETEVKIRALTLKNTQLTGDVGVTIGGKVTPFDLPSLVASGAPCRGGY